MNIYDISKKAGVSIATVSRVLNNSTSVSEKTRKKVMDVIEQTGYTPNALAQGLTTGQTRLVGVMCPDLSDDYLAKGVYYIEQALRRGGYDCILCCTGLEGVECEKYVKLLIMKKVDAIILVGSHYVVENPADTEYIKRAAEEIPVFLVNASLTGENIYCVFCDDKKIVYETTRRFLDMGCQKIMFLYNSDSYSGKNKLLGYKLAVSQAKLPYNILFCPKGIDETMSLLKQEIWVKAPPDAVICAEDYLAISTVKYAEFVNIHIPDRLQIVGYNNSVLSKCTNPPLTSIDNRVKDLSEIAVKNLLKLFSGEKIENQISITCKIKKRGTTK